MAGSERHPSKAVKACDNLAEVALDATVDVVMHGATPGPGFVRNARPGARIAARDPRGRSWSCRAE